MVVAIQHFDLWSLRLAGELRKGAISNRYHVALDLAVVILVAVLSITVNIALAVFVGVAIAIALFVLRMSESVIRRSYRCGAVHSRRSRLAPEQIFLEEARRGHSGDGTAGGAVLHGREDAGRGGGRAAP
jgi:SulP family sulfate permease